MSKPQRNISLKWRTFFFVVTVITVIMSISAIWTVYQTSQRDMKELVSRGQLLAEMQAKALSEPMWDLNSRGIQALILALEKDQDFRRAIVFNKTGLIIAQFGEETTEPDDLKFKSPIVYLHDADEHLLGELELVLSQDSLKQAFYENLLSEIQVALILLFATVGTILLVLTYLIIRPLRELTTVIDKVSQGNLDQVIPLKRFDEFGVMITAFNTMTRALAKNHRVIEERTNELLETNKRLELAKVEAEMANHTKSKFLTNMSHELRTPLNAIIGYSEIMIEEADEFTAKDRVSDLQRIISSAHHLLQLINELLDLSKIEAGKMTLNLEHFDLSKMISEIQTLMNPLMIKGKNRLSVHIAQGIKEIYSDEMKLRQSVLNLLGNAAKFTHNGNIILSVKHEVANDNSWVIITVQDTGIGMTEEQMQKVFNAFTQADESTTRRYGGTGLGLAIAKKICNLLGGDIYVASKVGKGAMFSIKLPVEAPAE